MNRRQLLAGVLATACLRWAPLRAPEYPYGSWQQTLEIVACMLRDLRETPIIPQLVYRHGEEPQGDTIDIQVPLR